MVIVEGPDGAGKTKLCKAISKHFDLEIVAPQKNGQMPIVPVRNRVYRALGKAVQGHKPAKIYDRLYLSELVYGHVIRGETAFSEPEKAFIDKVILSLGCPVVFCIPDYDTCVENLEKVDQMKGVKENFEAIYEMYSRFADAWISAPAVRGGSGAIVHDYEVEVSKDNVMGHIDGYLRRRHKREYFVYPAG